MDQYKYKYFCLIYAGVGCGPTYQSSKPWSKLHYDREAKYNVGDPEEHHIQPTLPGKYKYKSKVQMQLLSQAGEQVGAVSSVEEASLVRRWENC